MKIFVPFPYYYPEQCAGINIIDDILRSCTKEGIEVQLYVPTPTRNVPRNAQWEVDDIQENGLFKIHRFRMYGEGKNPFLRALRYLLNECAYLYALLRYDYDVIFLDSTPPIQGLKIPIVKLFRRKPVIYNAQDIFPESLVGAGLAKKGGLLWHIGSIVSKITYHFSDKIVVISDGFKKTLTGKGVPADKIEIIYNWVDENKVIPIGKNDNPLYKEFGLDKTKFRVVYAGNLGHAQNIGVILAAADRLKGRQNIEFVIFGSGGLEEDIKNTIKGKQLTNVRIFPLQPSDRVSFVYGLGDICIVSCKKGFGGSAMPSKTWSILSAGRPVLANFDDGDLKHILESNRCGIFTEANDVNAMVTAISQLSENIPECDEMGFQGRKFIEINLKKDVNISRYRDMMKQMVIKNNSKH